jgi:hypothetical protein
LAPITIASEVIARAAADRRFVGELHGLAHARALADQECLSEHAKHRLQPRKHIRRAGHHDGKRAVLGAGRTAAHRRIYPDNAFRGKTPGHFDRHARAGSREVDESSRARARRHAVASQRNFAHHRWCRQTRQDQFHERREFGRRTRSLRSARKQR